MSSRTSLEELRMILWRRVGARDTVRYVAEGLAARGLVTIDGDAVSATDATDAAAEVLRESERRRIQDLVRQWPGDEPEVDELVAEVEAELFS